MTDDIADVLTALETAWNDLDARAVAATFSSDGIYVTRAGVVWRGRPAIESGFAKSFEGPLADLTLTLKPLAVRSLSTAVSLILADVNLSNDNAMVRAIITFVLAYEEHGWLIVSAHTSETPSIH